MAANSSTLLLMLIILIAATPHEELDSMLPALRLRSYNVRRGNAIATSDLSHDMALQEESCISALRLRSHAAPRRLSVSDLIVITSSTIITVRRNRTVDVAIDDVPLEAPGMYYSSHVVVHRLAGALNSFSGMASVLAMAPRAGSKNFTGWLPRRSSDPPIRATADQEAALAGVPQLLFFLVAVLLQHSVLQRLCREEIRRSSIGAKALIILMMWIHFLINGVAAIPREELDNMLPVLRLRGYNRFGNAIETSDLNLHDFLGLDSLTLFAPTDDSLCTLDMALPADFYISALQLHAVPRRLSVSDLLLLPPSTVFATLLPNHTLSVTVHGTRTVNIAVNGVPLEAPGLYYSSHVVVHGLAGALSNHFTSWLPRTSSDIPIRARLMKAPSGSAAAATWDSAATTTATAATIVILVLAATYLCLRRPSQSSSSPSQSSQSRTFFEVIDETLREIPTNAVLVRLHGRYRLMTVNRVLTELRFLFFTTGITLELENPTYSGLLVIVEVFGRCRYYVSRDGYCIDDFEGQIPETIPVVTIIASVTPYLSVDLGA